MITRILGILYESGVLGSGGSMGRVEKFRQKRTLRKKYMIAVVVFITLLTAGFYTADYSVSNLTGMDRGLKIFNIINTNDRVQFVFMNQKIELDLEYVNSDLEKVRQFFAGIFDKS